MVQPSWVRRRGWPSRTRRGWRCSWHSARTRSWPAASRRRGRQTSGRACWFFKLVSICLKLVSICSTGSMFIGPGGRESLRLRHQRRPARRAHWPEQHGSRVGGMLRAPPDLACCARHPTWQPPASMCRAILRPVAAAVNRSYPAHTPSTGGPAGACLTACHGVQRLPSCLILALKYDVMQPDVVLVGRSRSHLGNQV